MKWWQYLSNALLCTHYAQESMLANTSFVSATNNSFDFLNQKQEDCNNEDIMYKRLRLLISYEVSQWLKVNENMLHECFEQEIRYDKKIHIVFRSIPEVTKINYYPEINYYLSRMSEANRAQVEQHLNLCTSAISTSFSQLCQYFLKQIEGFRILVLSNIGVIDSKLQQLERRALQLK